MDYKANNIYKMKKKYIQNISVFVVIVVIALMYVNLKESKLEENGQRTIGRVESIFWAKGGMSCSYSYTVNNQDYESKSFIYENEVKVGDFYYVEYDKNSPNNSKILFEQKANGYDNLND